MIARLCRLVPRGGGARPAPVERPIEHSVMLTATLCLLAVGAVMVYSASSARDLLSGQGDGTGKLLHHVAYAAAGLLLMRWLAHRGLDGVRSATPALLLVSFGLLVVVLVPGIGVNVNGARRWIGAGPLQFQPSELMKVAIVLCAAKLTADRPRLATSLRRGHGPLLVVTLLACGLVAVQPDLGTALVIAGTVGALLIAAGVPLRKLAGLLALAGVAVAIFAVLEPYRRARLTSFLDPWADPGGAGFQSVQGQIALGSGGLFGVGLGQSVQKVFYLPEAHTDFILAVLGEELGAVGIMGVLALYGMIAWAGLRTARRAKDLWSSLVAVGMTALILCQATLNVFTVLGIAPLTGVPLPFISYGSSNLLVLLGGMGLLLNVAAGGTVRARQPRAAPANAPGEALARERRRVQRRGRVAPPAARRAAG